ncbi:MAG TPA: M28 family metallopeptidase [Blastocatellia bacterium]|nr:M28 family metallopeptidase [Blastocatellia bacterium]
MKKHILFHGALIACVTFTLACATDTAKNNSAPAAPADIKPALDSVTSDDLLRHIKTLASDEYEGRAPGTKGEELTVNYLTEQFKRLGLKPGNPDGSYAQKVPLIGYTPQPSASFSVGGKRMSLATEDYLARSPRFAPETKVENSDLVFVGYGVVAPEYGWDDFKGVDVKGKTIVMLINDPPVPDPADPNKLDEKMFKGRAMTYYGRWTYKYEIASEKGAAAAIIVHETGPAGYPFAALASWRQENFGIKGPDNNMGKNISRVAVESWITVDSAKRLFTAAGKDFEALKKAALGKDFKPVPLNAKANFTIKTALREIASTNVIAKLEGSDAKLKDEYLIYTAHWDHMGRDPKLQGDQIFNGAHDNASGTAGLLELAKAFAKLNPAPKRSILFLAVTAEEKGLLGAKYYAENPLYPHERTLANINMDGLNQWGRTRDVVIVGYGNSTLDDTVIETASAQGRVVKPDAEPEKGFFYRSDHFEFAKQGVPALYTDEGTEFIGKPEGYGMQKRKEYTERDYHKVSDEVKADWDLSGAVEDLQLLFQVGYRVAQGEKWPEWKPGAEFKARREEALKRAKA